MSDLYKRETTLALLHEFTKTEGLRRHAYAVEASMKASAERTGNDVECTLPDQSGVLRAKTNRHFL